MRRFRRHSCTHIDRIRVLIAPCRRAGKHRIADKSKAVELAFHDLSVPGKLRAPGRAEQALRCCAQTAHPAEGSAGCTRGRRFHRDAQCRSHFRRHRSQPHCRILEEGFPENCGPQRCRCIQGDEIAWAVRKGRPRLKAFLNHVAVASTSGHLTDARQAIFTRYLKNLSYVKSAAAGQERKKFLALMESSANMTTCGSRSRTSTRRCLPSPPITLVPTAWRGFVTSAAARLSVYSSAGIACSLVSSPLR